MKNLVGTLLAAVLLTAGCDTADVDVDPPAVLPSEAFSMDLESLGGVSKYAAGPNFTTAVLYVLPVSAAVGVHLVIPAVLTEQALKTTPEFDGSWMWSSSTVVESARVDYTLTATPRLDGIDWSMVVGFSDGELTVDPFELYTAHTSLNGRSGSWQLYYDLEGTHTKALEADFEIEDADTKELTFTVTGGDPNYVGDSVIYAASGDNRLFVLTQAGEGTVHRVEWNAASGAGSITSDGFNGGEQSCWNESREDADCGP